MQSLDLLRTLSSAFGPSGFEDDVRSAIQTIVEPWVDDLQVDVLGNLMARKNGRGDRTLLIDAHMDEIGFMVTWIEDSGFLRFTTLGGWDARIIPSHVMTIRTDNDTFIKGMIGTPPPHILAPDQQDRPFRVEDLFIDIGARSADEVRALGIRIGSPAVISYAFEQLNADTVLGKALDDRAGCAVLVKTMEALKDEHLSVNVVASFVVQEEVGLRGAQTATYTINPDIAIALEGTVAADTPGVPPPSQPTRQFRGPSIRILDSGMIGMPRMIRALAAVAEECEIPYQYQVPARGGTDAGVIHRTRHGVLTGAISVPCRYIHSPGTVMRLSDFEATVRLVTEFARRCPDVVGMP